MENMKLPDFFNKGTPDLRKASKKETVKIYSDADFEICSCGCNTFKVIIEIIIDDAQLICSSCGKNQSI